MKIVIVGAGAVGTHLSRLLSREHQDCVLIDDDEERLSGLGEYDVMTYCASPTSIKALKEAGVHHADLFVGVTPEESINLNACILAHALGAKKTVARIDNYEYLAPGLQQFFKNLGLDSLIYPEVLVTIKFLVMSQYENYSVALLMKVERNWLSIYITLIKMVL